MESVINKVIKKIKKLKNITDIPNLKLSRFLIFITRLNSIFSIIFK